MSLAAIASFPWLTTSLTLRRVCDAFSARPGNTNGSVMVGLRYDFPGLNDPGAVVLVFAKL